MELRQKYQCFHDIITIDSYHTQAVLIIYYVILFALKLANLQAHVPLLFHFIPKPQHKTKPSINFRQKDTVRFCAPSYCLCQNKLSEAT